MLSRPNNRPSFFLIPDRHPIQNKNNISHPIIIMIQNHVLWSSEIVSSNRHYLIYGHFIQIFNSSISSIRHYYRRCFYPYPWLWCSICRYISLSICLLIYRTPVLHDQVLSNPHRGDPLLQSRICELPGQMNLRPLALADVFHLTLNPLISRPKSPDERKSGSPTHKRVGEPD